MPQFTRRVAPAAPAGTFARGWNARAAGTGFDVGETEDWKTGWHAADKVPADQRRPFNDTVPISNSRLAGKGA